MRKSVFFLTLGALFAGMVSFLIISYVDGLQKQVNVVVAVHDLKPFEEIHQEDVTVRSIPSAGLVDPNMAYLKVEDVIGKYTQSYISQNTFISPSNTSDEPGGPLVLQLNKQKNGKMRAMEIPIKEKNLQKKIKPGDYIDFLGTVPVAKSINGVLQNVKETTIIASHVEVLETNIVVNQDKSQTSDGTIIVAVEYEKAVDITHALMSGNLTMMVQPSFAVSEGGQP